MKLTGKSFMAYQLETTQTKKSCKQSSAEAKALINWHQNLSIEQHK